MAMWYLFRFAVFDYFSLLNNEEKKKQTSTTGWTCLGKKKQKTGRPKTCRFLANHSQVGHTGDLRCAHWIVLSVNWNTSNMHLHKTCLKWATSHFTIFHTAFWQLLFSAFQGLPPVPRDFSRHRRGRAAFPNSRLLDHNLHHGVWSSWMERKCLFLIKEDLTETDSRCRLVAVLRVICLFIFVYF